MHDPRTALLTAFGPLTTQPPHRPPAQVLRTDGLHAALLDRQFAFDVMVHTGGAFSMSMIQPGSNWRADYTTRYRPESILQQTVQYVNPNAKRLFKGEGAIPEWIQQMKDSGRLKRLSVELAKS